MATSMQLHKGEVTTRLDLSNCLAVAVNLEVLHLGLLEVFVTRPLKLLSPGLVSKPVADIIGIAGIDQDRYLSKDAGNDTVVRLHPVTLEQEVAVDVKVAGLVRGDFSAQGLHDLLLIEILLNPVEFVVAQRVATARLANVVDILASALIRANHGIVAVDGGRDARPDRLGLVAVLDEAGAARVGVVHGLALALVQDSGPATLSTGHGPVVLVLGQAIGEAIADENGLQVDVALLVGQNLRGKDGNVVSSIGFARDVEALLGVLRKLLEEEGEQGVDVLASCDGVADLATRVGEADVDGLVEKDDGSIAVPRIVVVLDLAFLCDGGRAQLHEETGQRGAAGPTIEPEHDGIVLGVVSRLKEPWWLLAGGSKVGGWERSYSRTNACPRGRRPGSRCTA